jgi:Spy/CpxP family protein refolding chaperone
MSIKRATRTRLTTAGILILVLATGVVLGLAVAPRVTDGAVAEEVQARGGGGERGDRSSGGSGRRRPLIVEQVGLSETQKTQVDSIVRLQRERYRALQEEFDEAYMPRYRALMEETRAAVKGVLTSDQRTMYDSLLAEHDLRRRERRESDTKSRSRR